MIRMAWYAISSWLGRYFWVAAIAALLGGAMYLSNKYQAKQELEAQRQAHEIAYAQIKKERAELQEQVDAWQKEVAEAERAERAAIKALEEANREALKQVIENVEDCGEEIPMCVRSYFNILGTQQAIEDGG